MAETEESNSLALVTGASGFIGNALCQHLQARGKQVRVLMRHHSVGPWNEEVNLDLACDPVPDNIMRDVHTVFHLAGRAHALSETIQVPDVYERVNVEGTRKLLQAAHSAGVRRFVFFSSVKAMGEGGPECLDECAPCNPATPYGRSKLKAEHLVLKGGYVAHPVVLRLCMVYGQIEKGNLAKMIEAVRCHRFPPLPEAGNKRSMAHVEDVVEAALLAAESPQAAGQIYILADGCAYSTRQIYEWICEALSRPVPGWKFPMCLLKLLARIGDGIGLMCGTRFMFDTEALQKLTASAWYSSQKIQQQLGFRPGHTLRESLPEIVYALGEKL